MKKHLIYIIIIFILSIYAFYLSIPKFRGYGKEKYYFLKKDITLYHNKEIVGKLKKGIIIKKPSYYDFDDVNNNIKRKIILLPTYEQYNTFLEIDTNIKPVVYKAGKLN